jgi:hypothetical protein
VAEHPLNDLRIRARTDRQGRRGVPQIMGCYPRECLVGVLASFDCAPSTISLWAGRGSRRPAPARSARRGPCPRIIPQGTNGHSGNLWGANIYATTQVAAGTAVVASVKAGAGIFWQRLGLLIFFNPWSLMSSNEYFWVCEERVAWCQSAPPQR